MCDFFEEKYFKTDDGYRLFREGDYWTDGDIVFESDKQGHPVDEIGDRLDGRFC